MPGSAVRYTGARVVIGASDEFASAPVLNAIAYLVGQVTTIQSVKVGAPEAAETRVSATVSLGALQPSQKFGPDVLQREVRALVAFFYRTQGAEQTAEVSIAAAVDAFTRAFYSARPSELFGTLRQMKLDVTVADDPNYQIAAGQENRVYPLVVTGVQQQRL